MTEKELVSGVAKVVGNKKVAKEAINRVLEIAKKKGKVCGLNIALVVILAALNFSALAVAASAPAASDTDWNKTVAAAKKEGKVVIIGPSGADVKDACSIRFQNKYP